MEILTLGGVHKLRLQDLSFFDHLPPSVYIFYGIKVYKKSIFLTTYPPPLINVVCERPPTDFNQNIQNEIIFILRMHNLLFIKTLTVYFKQKYNVSKDCRTFTKS